jgi:hypothetical protein
LERIVIFVANAEKGARVKCRICGHNKFDLIEQTHEIRKAIHLDSFSETLDFPLRKTLK